MDEYYLFTFMSTHAAISTEKILKPIGAIVMPVPRFISSSCGISIRVNPENHEDAERIFKEKSKLKACVNDVDDCDFSYYHVFTDGKSGKTECERIEI